MIHSYRLKIDVIMDTLAEMLLSCSENCASARALCLGRAGMHISSSTSLALETRPILSNFQFWVASLVHTVMKTRVMVCEILCECKIRFIMMHIILTATPMHCYRFVYAALHIMGMSITTECLVKFKELCVAYCNKRIIMCCTGFEPQTSCR